MKAPRRRKRDTDPDDPIPEPHPMQRMEDGRIRQLVIGPVKVDIAATYRMGYLIGREHPGTGDITLVIEGLRGQ